MINGIINVYKEAGFTSHDVVAKLRGIAKQKKIGHTGTLDPDATGVLPVCLGRATKVSGMLTDEKKTYECLMLLGMTTDTQDISGRVLKQGTFARAEDEAAAEAQKEQVRQAAASFLGPQMQIPPMYSALKKNGRKLYELAREGITVEREPRPVHFYEIEILQMDIPRVRFRVTCSRGTYIRTLCSDIGERLGYGACMESLVRTQVGPFRLEDALRLEEIQKRKDEGRLLSCVTPVDCMFWQYPAVRALPEGDRLLHNGNPIPAGLLIREERGSSCRESDGKSKEQADGKSGRQADAGIFRVYDSEGSFTGIFRRKKELLKPETMFYDPDEVIRS